MINGNKVTKQDAVKAKALLDFSIAAEEAANDKRVAGLTWGDVEAKTKSRYVGRSALDTARMDKQKVERHRDRQAKIDADFEKGDRVTIQTEHQNDGEAGVVYVLQDEPEKGRVLISPEAWTSGAFAPSEVAYLSILVKA